MAVASPPTPSGPRHFGRFELRQMLGRSLASSSWLAWDPRLGQELLLCVPRAQPQGAAEKDAWTQDVLASARLKHPRLTEVLEVGAHEAWPFVTCVREGAVTLAERLAAPPALTPIESASLICDVLEGLAYAHEAGASHQDIGLHTVVLDASGRAMLAGLSAGLMQLGAGELPRPRDSRQMARQNAERDVLMVGLLLHRLLANHPALDDPDFNSAAKRVGPEIVRLPWTTPHPVPETLRAIVNRATDRQHRQRYLNARTLLSALQGWLKTNSQESGGPLLLLLDRLNSVGVLPSRPGTEAVLARALKADTLRVDDFVDVVVKNPAVVWELLRSVNVASFRSRSSDDGVTTLSRAVMLLGQQGIRRVAGVVRPWPGALGAQGSVSQEASLEATSMLRAQLRLTCLAGHLARLLTPFSVHDEEASVTAMSQRLGMLLILYHFPDEGAQIRRLMQPGPPPESGAPPTPGMTLDAAAGAVLGINLDDLTQAVLRHWGLHDRLQQGSRPLSLTTPVRTPQNPEEILRTVASLANEMVNASILEPAKSVSALHQTYLRYARALGLTPKECNATLEQATRLVDARPASESVNPA